MKLPIPTSAWIPFPKLKFRFLGWSLLTAALSLLTGCTRPTVKSKPQPLLTSSGVYRIPYGDGTRVSIFDDALTHRPQGRVDFVAEPTDAVHTIVAAADGVVMAVQDSYFERQSARAASECRNNFVWIAHPNGEWTLYGHMRQWSSSRKAGLRIGQHVNVGQYLGDEGDVGCAMLSHLHFEVAVPASQQPIDAGGFLTDNQNNKRNRIPRFGEPVNGAVIKGATYSSGKID